MAEVQTAFPLIHNKVTSPHYATPTLRRERLLRWLHERSDCRAIVVAADAGYGKTTLLWQWEQEVAFPCYWFKLDRSDRDWSIHVSYLIEAIAQRHPGFGHKAHRMLLQLGGPGSSRPGVAAFLLSEMHQRLTEPCTFIIDDWQYVSSQTDVRGLWNQILRDAPKTCRFVFLSRSRPQLQFARFRTHGGYGELRTDALRFTESEIDELFRDIYADPLEPSEVVELDRRTEGWAACLQLVGVTLRERVGSAERRAFIESIAAASNTDLFAFLAEEVLDQQADQTRNFLLSTSILSQITPDLAQRMTGVGDGSRLLQDLEQKGLFTNRLGDAEERFRYHGLFREFLERRLSAERGPAEVAGLHIHAASYYETSLQWPQAIHHYLRANLQRQAARLIAKYGEDVAEEGRLGLIDGWLGELSPKGIRDNARLSLLYGEAQWTIRGEWEAALAALGRALLFFERKGDRRTQALSLLKLSSLHSALGDVARTAEYARRGLEVVPTDADVLRLRLDGNVAVSETWMNTGLEQVAAACRRLVVEATMRGLEHYAAIANHNLGMVLRNMGRLHESAEALERSARFWDSEPGSPFADNSELVQTYLALGDLKQAERWSERGLRATREWRRPHLEARWAKAAVMASRGRFTEAVAILEGLMAAQGQLGSVRDMVSSLLAECLYLARQPAVTLVEPLTAMQAAADPRLEGMVAPALALARHSVGDCRGECLESRSALARLRKAGATYASTAGEVKIGPLVLDHLGEDAVGEVSTTLVEAGDTRLIQSHRFWLREYQRHISLLLSSPEGRTAVLLAMRVDPESWCPPVANHIQAIPEDDRRDVLSALTRLAQPQALDGLAEPLPADVAAMRRSVNLRHAPRLFIRSLGLIAIHHGSWQAAPLLVGKRRMALLLGLLLAQDQGSIPRERVLDILWPESDPDAAVNSLNQTVFQLRRTLDPDYRDRESPAYIVTSSEALGLNTELVHTDLQEFREAAARLKEAGTAGERFEAAETMVVLARGEFLSEIRYEDWVIESQGAVHAEIRMHLLQLARGEINLPPDMSIRAAGALIALDRFDEGAHLALVRQLVGAGRRNAAREALIRYAVMNATEFHDDPTPEVLEALASVKVDVAEVNQRLTNRVRGLTLPSEGH